MKLEKVVGASRYSFEDRDTKRLVEGVNVWFMVPSGDENTVGEIPKKVSLPIEAWGHVSKLRFPDAYNAVIDQTFTSRGIKSKVVGLEALFAEKK